jgi:O-acetylhomoserine/O-acetylserine sulfhydrylase-like pyridoxal-dependent enzyme
MRDDEQPESDQDHRESDFWFADLPRRRTRGPQLGDDHAGYRMHTRVVHAGQYDDPLTGSIGTPIFQGTTFRLGDDTYRAMDEGRGRESLVYGRYGNPSQWAVQAKMAALEGAESSLVFS